MKTIADLVKETEKTSLTFNQISSETTDFEHYEWLNKPYFTLLMKKEFSYIVLLTCEDLSTTDYLKNGNVYEVEVEDNYIYDAQIKKSNSIIEL